MTVSLYPTVVSKMSGNKKKYKKVEYSTSDIYEEKIQFRMDEMYHKLAAYSLVIAIRDLTYDGANAYLLQSKRKAIKWFVTKNTKNPLGYGTICQYFGFNADRFWLQIRRWLKVDPGHIIGSLKSVELAIFDNPRSVNVKAFMI